MWHPALIASLFEFRPILYTVRLILYTARSILHTVRSISYTVVEYAALKRDGYKLKGFKHLCLNSRSDSGLGTIRMLRSHLGAGGVWGYNPVKSLRLSYTGLYPQTV